MDKLRVLVADDHEEIRWVIVKILAEHFNVVGAVADGRSLVDAAIDLKPDVIVSDVSMPELTGPEAMGQLRSRSNGTPFVLMSGNPTCLGKWVEEGAEAFVDKIDVECELVAAVRSAAAREIYFSSSARSFLLIDPLLRQPTKAESRRSQ